MVTYSHWEYFLPCITNLDLSSFNSLTSDLISFLSAKETILQSLVPHIGTYKLWLEMSSVIWQTEDSSVKDGEFSYFLSSEKPTSQQLSVL